MALFGRTVNLLMAAAWTCFGKLPGRWDEWASRAQNPKRYWSMLASFYLAGIGFIGYYLHTVHAF